MRIQKDTGTLRAQFVDDIAHQAPADRIETRSRFIQDHQRRPVQQCLREPDALQHALGKRAQLFAAEIGQPNPFEEFGRTALQFVRPHSEQLPVQVEKFARCQPFRKTEMLGQETNARKGGAIPHRRPEQIGTARGGLDQTKQHFDRGSFARAVGTQKAKDLTLLHLQGEALDGRAVAENFS